MIKKRLLMLLILKKDIKNNPLTPFRVGDLPLKTFNNKL
jgi:hypothetical protein